MRCVSLGPLGVMCLPDVTDAVVTGKSGKVYHFDFDERFGPLLLGKNGAPLTRQPVSERHEFWPAFEEWLDARRGLPPKCTACKGAGLVAAQALTKRTAIGKPCPRCNGSGRQAR